MFVEGGCKDGREGGGEGDDEGDGGDDDDTNILSY